MKFSWQFLLAAICAGYFVGTPSSRAADRDDIYVTAMGGASIERQKNFQLGILGGYLFWDALGFGLGFDQTFQPRGAAGFGAATQYYGESRWFLEPFEVFAGFGVRNLLNSQGHTQVRPLFLSGADYLVALTASLALRAEVRAQYLSGNSTILPGWSAFTGVGVRLLY